MTNNVVVEIEDVKAVLITVQRDNNGSYDVLHGDEIKHPDCGAEGAMRALGHYLHSANYSLGKLSRENEALKETLKTIAGYDVAVIGKEVTKRSRKPFKDGEKINTVTGYTKHPVTGRLCYTLKESDTYVEVQMCKEADATDEPDESKRMPIPM